MHTSCETLALGFNYALGHTDSHLRYCLGQIVCQLGRRDSKECCFCISVFKKIMATPGGPETLSERL